MIPLHDVRDYTAAPLNLLHRFRIWGSSDLRRWLPLDTGRPFRSTLVTLEVAGTRWRPAFTPLRPEEFVAQLDEVLGR